MSVRKLREMFERMVVGKDPAAIAEFYAPSFELHSNGDVQDYATFAKGHERLYATAITYSVEFDEEAWVESENRVAARVWITTKPEDGPATRIEVVLIVAFEDGRIRRIWETTWPDWTGLGGFETYR